MEKEGTAITLKKTYNKHFFMERCIANRIFELRRKNLTDEEIDPIIRREFSDHLEFRLTNRVDKLLDPAYKGGHYNRAAYSRNQSRSRNEIFPQKGEVFHSKIGDRDDPVVILTVKDHGFFTFSVCEEGPSF